mmetsp:Transcript_5011/g.6373  ORF Transcript_5011/g.6373 Transcript_5011/m.6373 type:complete len:170 (-) Transcript_5011:164-673(-)
MQVVEMNSLNFSSRRRVREDVSGFIDDDRKSNRDKRVCQTWSWEDHFLPSSDNQGEELGEAIQIRKRPEIVLSPTALEHENEHCPKRQCSNDSRSSINRNTDDLNLKNETEVVETRIETPEENLEHKQQKQLKSRRCFQPPPSIRSCPIPFGGTGLEDSMKTLGVRDDR